MRKGQAMLEYMLVLVAMLALVGVMGYVIVAAERHAARTERLVRSDYP